MADPRPDDSAELSAHVKALEDESRRLLAALKWSSTVRNILLLLLIAFVVTFSFLFYQLYQDITNRRIVEVRQLLEERQDEFIEPLTREVFSLAETTGPEVFAIFRAQAVEDAPLYMKAFDKERAEIATSFEIYLQQKLDETHKEMLKEQESVIREEFPELADREKLDQFRDNMEATFQQIGKRYYVDFFKQEFEKLITSLDNFPQSEPKDQSEPLAEQVASEMLELVQMMLAKSENYVAVDEAEALKAIANEKDPEPDSDEAGKDDSKSDSTDDQGDDDGGSTGDDSKDDGDGSGNENESGDGTDDSGDGRQ